MIRKEHDFQRLARAAKSTDVTEAAGDGPEIRATPSSSL
jgi:hypothetical protein